MISEETNHSNAWLFIVIGCSDSSVIHTNTYTYTAEYSDLLFYDIVPVGLK